MDKSTERTVYAPLWVSEPNGRGTWSVLYSCVFTLSLCVWSAIHLNIPPRGEPPIRQWLRKTNWVIIAILATEVVLYSAWQQYYIARRFSREMNKISREQYGRQGNNRTTWWEYPLENVRSFSTNGSLKTRILIQHSDLFVEHSETTAVTLNRDQGSAIGTGQSPKFLDDLRILRRCGWLRYQRQEILR